MFPSYVISIQPDRYQIFQERVKITGLNPTISQGVIFKETVQKARPQDFGCLLSHWHIWEQVKEPTIIFEDDAIFRDDFKGIFPKALDQLPDDWNILWIGRKKQLQARYSENLKIALGCHTHAYLVHPRAIPLMLKGAEIHLRRRIGYWDHLQWVPNQFTVEPILSIQTAFPIFNPFGWRYHEYETELFQQHCQELKALGPVSWSPKPRITIQKA